MAVGHSYSAVMDEYSIDELTIYYEAALRNQARETRRFATAVRAATQANKRGWREYLQHLSNAWKEIEKAAGRQIHSVENFFAGLGMVKGRRRRNAHNRTVPRQHRD